MKKEENTDDEFLKDLYPRLFNNKIVVNSEPPEGYFENLQGIVMDRIHALPEKQTKTPAKAIRFINVRNMAIAATAAIFLALIPYFKSVFKSDTNPTESGIFSMYDDNEFVDLGTYTDDADLYDALAAEGIHSLVNTEKLTDEEIIEYLINEGYNEDLYLENI